MSFLKSSKNDHGVVDTFMRDPNLYGAFAEMLAHIMSGTSDLTTEQREMIALHVSNVNDCLYCVQSHTAVLIHKGIDVNVIKKIQTGQSAEAKMQSVLTFSSKLTLQPGVVDQADIDAIKVAGWSDQAVENVIAVVSLFSFLNRLVDGLGIEGDEKSIAQGAAMIAEHGYQPVARMVKAEANNAA